MSESPIATIFDAVRNIRRDGWSMEGVIDQLSSAITRPRHEPGGSMSALSWAKLVREDGEAAELAHKIVRHAIRFGWDLDVGGDPQTAAQLRESYAMEEDRLSVPLHMLRGLSWGRVGGIAATWIGTVDRSSPDKPMPSQIDRVAWLETFSASQIQAIDVDRDPRSDYYQKPSLYRLTRKRTVPAEGAGTIVHASRLILWPGNELTDPALESQADWWADDSVLTISKGAIEASARNHLSSEMLLHRISQMVIKIRFLAEMMAGKRQDDVDGRVRLLERARSVGRILPIDIEEEIANIPQPIAGVGELHQISDRRMGAGQSMPRGVLVSDGITQLDREAWTEEVAGYQQLVVRPRHERIAQAIMRSANFQRSTKITREPDQWRITYRPTTMVRPEVGAAIRKTNAETAQIEINAGIIKPESAALAWHTGLGQGDIRLDAAEMKAAIDRRAALAGEAPKDNAQLGTQAPRAGGGQLAIVSAVHAGTVSRESGKEILVRTFQLLEEHAEAMLGPVDSEADDEAEPTIEGAPAGVAAVQDTALNGAQVAELRGTLEAVQLGTLDAVAAVELITVSFPSVARATAQRMVDAQANARPKVATPLPATRGTPEARPQFGGERGSRGPAPEPAKGVGAGAPQGAPGANAGGNPDVLDTTNPKASE